MRHWATAALVAFGTTILTAQLAMAASPPLPKPKPDRTASANPEAALSRFVDAPPALTSSVAAYAPTGAAATIAPRVDEAALYMVGKLSPDGEPIGHGLVWHVFKAFPGADGTLPLVEKVEGGDLELRLKPGRYVVNATYGRASASREINVAEAVVSEALVLDAGGLLLSATLGEDEALASDVLFELSRIDGGERSVLGTVSPGTIARLPAGAYHIVSRYGDVNAVRSADVIVEAGKLTRVAMRHQAGSVRLKLVRDDGGEALANTEWTVYTDRGEAIFERVGAHASVTLAAGNYAVVARHRNSEFSRSFTVQTGDEADVVVLARRMPAL